MEFNYVAGWYSRKTMQVKPLGGFLDIKSAKEFSDLKDTFFWEEGFLCIDSPEGIYINGYEKYSDVHTKWFTPEEVSKKDIRVFSSSKDKNMLLDEFLPYDVYEIFKGNGNIFQELKSTENSSIKEKLSENKKIVESRDREKKDSQQERTKQHEHNNNER